MSLGSKWMWWENLIKWILFFFLGPVVLHCSGGEMLIKQRQTQPCFAAEESEYREYKHNMLPDLGRGDVCDPAFPAQSGTVTTPLEGFGHRPLRFVPII